MGVFDRWNTLRESVRWVLYLPTVLLSYLLLSVLLNFISFARGDFSSGSFFAFGQHFINAALCGGLYAWLSLNLAPRAPRISAWIITSPILFLWVFTILRHALTALHSEGDYNQEHIPELLSAIGWFLAATICLAIMGRKIE
jgi:hypothetical protein